MASRFTLFLTLVLAFSVAAGAFAQEGEAAPDSVVEIMSSDMSDDQKIDAINRLILLNPRNSDLYNNLGVVYAGREEWLLARDAFISAVQCDPRQADIHRNLGMSMLRLEQYDLAVAEFESYRRLAGDGGPDAFKLIGDAWHEAGDRPAALQAYRDGLEFYGDVYGPGSAELVASQVMLLEEMEDTAACEALLRQFAGPASEHLQASGGVPTDLTGKASLAITSRLLRIIVNDAQLMSESGLHAQAAAAYEEAMEIDPANEELLPLAAMAWFEAGETMKARVLAQRATTETPERPGGWRARGRIAETEKRPRDAIEAYRKAWELDQTQNDVAARIGAIYMSLGDNINARKFMGAVASDPDTPPEILYNYAISLQRSGDHELALHPLRKVVARQPKMVQAWKALASSLRRTKRYSEAARAYGRAFELQKDAKLAFQQGFCLHRCDRPLEAADAYQRSIDLDPVDTKARYNMGLVLISAGEYEEALGVFTVLADLEAESYRVNFNTGVCQQNLKRHEEALLAYEMALDIDETSAVWNNMGLVYDAMGDKLEAKQCYKEGKRLKEAGK